ncbi:transposase [Desulfarculales bacterium]
MHGPMLLVDHKRRETYLFAVIDGTSRLIAHAEFYLSEGLATYIQALRQALLKRGLPRKLYFDNGPAFRFHHLEERDHRLPGHRPGPLTALRAPG